MDNSTVIASQILPSLILPSLIAAVLFVVFAYLYRQSRAAYFRAWQLGWACYLFSYLMLIYYLTGNRGGLVLYCAKALFSMVPLFIFASTRMMKDEFHLRWYDFALMAAGLGWAALETRLLISRPGIASTAYLTVGQVRLPVDLDFGVAALLAFCAYRFWRHATRLHSLAQMVLSAALGIWMLILVGRHLPFLMQVLPGSYQNYLEPLPQMVVGLAMVMALYENERREVQENLLALSTLEMDTSRILDAADLEPALQKMLDRLLGAFHTPRGAFWVSDWWRRVLPAVQRGFSPEFLANLGQEGRGECLSDLVAATGGKLVIKNLESLRSSELNVDRLTHLSKALAREGVRALTAVSLQTRETNFGVLLFRHDNRQGFGSSQMRLLAAMARQVGMTLENYVLMQEAQRRTQEYELLTQIGQVVSSRLDPDEVLRTVQRELGRLFDTRTFYIAFMEADEEVRFELELNEGVAMPKRARRSTNGITEFIVRTGEPILVRSGMDKVRERLGIVPTGRPAKCFCGVPIFSSGRAVGVMAALNFDREFVYEQRDLDVMKTAAGQVAVAMENARLFAEEQRRAKYLEFLNSVSKTAISSQEPEAMLAEIVSDIQNNFRFDHIGIGILDYASKDIEIKAEAGSTEKALGRRIPLGVGILGRVARSNEMSLTQNAGEGRLLGIIPESKSVLCIPIAYGETLLGVLNVESRRENAFAQQEVLILRTLADLLATALHNAFVFQKMQQQSITDGLTGIKTRRFFNEALQSEWKRASRSGRPFSVVLIDLDRFKAVNDSMGHLEGDLVLARIGRILEQKSRQSNIVARYGGDEFVILMPETGVEQAQILSERLRLWIATDTTLNERQITASFGVAAFPLHGATAEDVLRIADMGMYTSKRNGGNRVSTPDDFGEGESLVSQKQLVTAYVEGFLQRQETGPENIDELVATLLRLSDAIRDGSNAEALMEAVRTLTLAAEAREVASAGHGEAVAKYAEAVGRELGLPADELADLVRAARVHDVGKILIPEAVLNRPEKLNDGDYGVVKMHSSLGARIVETVPGYTRVANLVRHHHERFDGTGYPGQLRGEEIPLGSRIIAVAETFVHMTIDRPYAPRRTSSQALAELESLSGTQFDGMVVRMFLRQMKGKAVRSGL
jgi:diguanylate cyclase (GGDEF)-like protein